MKGEERRLTPPVEGNMTFNFFSRGQYLREEVWNFLRNIADSLVRGPASSPVEEYGDLNAAVWGTLNDPVLLPHSSSIPHKDYGALSGPVPGFVGNTEISKVS